MSWARYDDELSINQKVGKLRALGVNGIAALGLHLLANTYCRHNGTKGIVEAHVPEMLAGRQGVKLAGILVTVGMFHLGSDGGWVINSYAEYHDPNDLEPDKSAADRKRELSEKRAAAGRLGGQAKASNAPSKTVALPQQTSSPVPDPVPCLDTSSVSTSSGGSNEDDDDEVIDWLKIKAALAIAAKEITQRKPRDNAYSYERAINLDRERLAAIRTLWQDYPLLDAAALAAMHLAPPTEPATKPAKDAWYANPHCDTCPGDGWVSKDGYVEACACRRDDPYIATVTALRPA